MKKVLGTLRVLLLCNSICGAEYRSIALPFSLEEGRNRNEFFLSSPLPGHGICVNGVVQNCQRFGVRLGDVIECGNTFFALLSKGFTGFPSNRSVGEKFRFVGKIISIIKDATPLGGSSDYLEARVEVLEDGGVLKTKMAISPGNEKGCNPCRTIELSASDQGYFRGILANPNPSGPKEMYQSSKGPSNYLCIKKEDEEEEEEDIDEIIAGSTKQYEYIIDNIGSYNNSANLNLVSGTNQSEMPVKMNFGGNSYGNSFPNREKDDNNNLYRQESFTNTDNDPLDFPDDDDVIRKYVQPKNLEQGLYSGENSSPRIVSKGRVGNNVDTSRSGNYWNENVLRTTNSDEYDQEKIIRSASGHTYDLGSNSPGEYDQLSNSGEYDPKFIEPNNLEQPYASSDNLPRNATTQKDWHESFNTKPPSFDESELTRESSSGSQKNSFLSHEGIFLPPQPQNLPSLYGSDGIKTQELNVVSLPNLQNLDGPFQLCYGLETVQQKNDVKANILNTANAQNNGIGSYLSMVGLNWQGSSRNYFFRKKQTKSSKKKAYSSSASSSQHFSPHQSSTSGVPHPATSSTSTLPLQIPFPSQTIHSFPTQQQNAMRFTQIPYYSHAPSMMNLSAQQQNQQQQQQQSLSFSIMGSSSVPPTLTASVSSSSSSSSLQQQQQSSSSSTTQTVLPGPNNLN